MLEIVMEMQNTASKGIIRDVKLKMSDILVAISWRDLARNYFGKSSSWLYHKMDGIDGNGGEGGFSPEEARQLKRALYDLAHRIQLAADSI